MYFLGTFDPLENSRFTFQSVLYTLQVNPPTLINLNFILTLAKPHIQKFGSILHPNHMFCLSLSNTIVKGAKHYWNESQIASNVL